ncbi:hypothetical protein [uncultured Pseudacidovorax sp.]|uniref:hypothetical protein n=1 Tax=uncultured Pseudacidovorax sp. TaxID=679313 RepID=UPI0025FF0388|nr:hypothetical protein [uncultured Pseudacidovorax sp.]
MARRELTYTATDGRDKGRVFQLTEMSANDAERWAIRAMLALIRNGVDIPDDAMNSGMAGLARVGITCLSKLNAEDALQLGDELMTCVRHIPNPKNPNVIRNLVEDDVEEIQTRLKLKVAVFRLHVDFSAADALSTLASASAVKSGA